MHIIILRDTYLPEMSIIDRNTVLIYLIGDVMGVSVSSPLIFNKKLPI